MSLLLVVPQNPSLNLDQNCSYHCNESEEAKLEKKKTYIYIVYSEFGSSKSLALKMQEFN
jgi:hypothetical protein